MGVVLALLVVAVGEHLVLVWLLLASLGRWLRLALLLVQRQLGGHLLHLQGQIGGIVFRPLL